MANTIKYVNISQLLSTSSSVSDYKVFNYRVFLLKMFLRPIIDLVHLSK